MNTALAAIEFIRVHRLDLLSKADRARCVAAYLFLRQHPGDTEAQSVLHRFGINTSLVQPFDAAWFADTCRASNVAHGEY